MEFPQCSLKTEGRPPNLKIIKSHLWLTQFELIQQPLAQTHNHLTYMSKTGLMRRLSLIGIDAIWQLSLSCLLMRTIASFLRYTGKRPYKSRFIANSSACTTTELSILLTSCLTAIKNHVIKYCTTVYERNDKNLIWSKKIR